MQVTIRFADPRTANASVDRALGCVLLETELTTARTLIGGFYFDTNRTPQEILRRFEACRFKHEDFASIEFSWS